MTIILASTLLALAALVASSGQVRSKVPIIGDATWYCNDDPRWPSSRCPIGFTDDDHFAAVPQGLGISEGDTIVVSRGSTSVTVPVVDTCADPCSVVVDLSRIAFEVLASPDRGRIVVSVGRGPIPTLPPTDSCA